MCKSREISCGIKCGSPYGTGKGVLALGPRKSRDIKISYICAYFDLSAKGREKSELTTNMLNSLCVSYSLVIYTHYMLPTIFVLLSLVITHHYIALFSLISTTFTTYTPSNIGNTSRIFIF